MEQELSGEQPKEISITYETLFELLRNEKGRAELQELPQTFFFDVVNYLVEKQNILEQAELKKDFFASAERDKARIQIENIRKILRELYERREKKIINMAISRSRTGSELTDLTPLLKEERELFNLLVDTLDRFRKGILLNITNCRNPSLLSEILGKTNAPEVSEIEPAEGLKPAERPKKETKLIRFLKPVPKFIGKELEVYGPFDAEDVASLPSEIADVLVSKGRAEAMDEA